MKAVLRVCGCWQDARVIGASYLDSTCTRGTRHLSLSLSIPLSASASCSSCSLSSLTPFSLSLSPPLPFFLSLLLALALSLSCSTLLSYCLLKSTCFICPSTVLQPAPTLPRRCSFVFFKNLLFSGTAFPPDHWLPTKFNFFFLIFFFF